MQAPDLLVSGLSGGSPAKPRHALLDDAAEDLALFDPGLEPIDADDDDDPEDLLEELGIF
jgi:hypothetical protein